MVVGIIDVGSNTARLLVADVAADGAVTPLRQERVYLRLGDDVHRLGHIGRRKLDESGDVAGAFARIARKAGAQQLETIVTAPGRQASNPEELVDTLATSTGAPVVVLSADDEGRLAWEGAVARLESPPEVVAVVDLGGGSGEIAVGTPLLGPAWVRSLDIGALRVTRSFLDGDRPSRDHVRDVRQKLRDLLADVEPPQPDLALAVGGTARAIGRVVGSPFGADPLDALVERLTAEPAEDVAEAHGVSPERALTMLGGALSLAEIARVLGCDLTVGSGGLREGAALALARAEAAAA